MSPLHQHADRIPLEVLAYSGSRGEEEPRALRLEERQLEVRTILDRWADPAGRYFRVSVADGSIHLLLCRETDLTWWRVTSDGEPELPPPSKEPQQPSVPEVPAEPGFPAVPSEPGPIEIPGPPQTPESPPPLS